MFMGLLMEASVHAVLMSWNGNRQAVFELHMLPVA